MTTILIVEDSEDMTNILNRTVSQMGYDVAEAKNGLEAIKAAKRIRPALIILDLMMPLASGDFALGFVRSTEGLKDTPVIIISAHPSAQAIATQLNAQACLEKPFNLDDLKRLITRYAPPPPPEAPPPESPK